MDEQIQAVRNMQAYIAEHLDDGITLADLARVSHFSPWYAHRLFAHHTGCTPADYIRRLRLSNSALKLRDESCKIADVAFAFGFKSVDGYQRAFFREFGCNPKEYANHPVPLYLFTPYAVEPAKTRKEHSMENIKTVFVHVVDRPARKLILKRGVRADSYFDYCAEVGCDVWGLLRSIKPFCGEPAGFWLPESLRAPGTSEYVQGVEVAPDYDGPVPEGFDAIDLPAAKYLMFRGEPFAEEDYCEAIEALWKAIENYDPSILGYSWDQSNPRIQLEPLGTRGYIELVPVK
ncbi:MAG: helix-turn-helix domain-containing protein [Christensenellales bacterium]|jgi:AraC family transcriptional regulator